MQLRKVMCDRWATDILPLAGEYFRTITKDLMWANKLFEGTMSVGGSDSALRSSASNLATHSRTAATSACI
jgi:hypothetical protein